MECLLRDKVLDDNNLHVWKYILDNELRCCNICPIMKDCKEKIKKKVDLIIKNKNNT